MEKTRIHRLLGITWFGLLVLMIYLALFASCASVSEPEVPTLAGTWRETSGSQFILIRADDLVFYYPNTSIGDQPVWPYEFDGRVLSFYGMMLSVQIVGNQMILSGASGYDGHYWRTGGY